MTSNMVSNVISLLNRSRAKYVDSAKNDVVSALNGFPDLTPDVENFVFPDKTRALTFRLKGTIPVLYKESKTVDKQGRIYLPYLTDWRFPGYDLSGLLQVIALCFQESCPVFAKPSGGSRSPNLGSSAVPYTPYPTSNASGMPPYPPSYYPSIAPNTGTVQPEHLKASVVSAVEHKVRQRLREKLGTIHAELASVRQTHSDLRAGQQKLKQIIDDLGDEQKRVEDALVVYQEKKSELSSIIASLPANKCVQLDELIDASTPLHKQLLRSYVYDCAIDDAIYFLGQVLNRGHITLSNYLREVRQLSRRQFIHRATLQKCRIQAKMPL